MAEETKEKATPRRSKKDDAEDTTPIFEETEEARLHQFPAKVGREGVEVAERTSDQAEDDSETHVKVFVLRKDAWDLESDDGKSEIHRRNINAVRQYMVGNGLRPGGDVSFVGEEEIASPRPDRPNLASVALRYEVGAVPAIVADELPTRHVVVPQDGPDAKENAEIDAERAARVRAAHDAVKVHPETFDARHPDADDAKKG